MQNNNNNGHGGHDMKMMWLMMLPCLLVPVIVLVVSGRSLNLAAIDWQWIIPIVLMLGFHLILMGFMHKHQDCSSVKGKEDKGS